MLVLTIRSDKPEAEVGLFDDNSKLEYAIWHAHRQLGATIHKKIQDLFVGSHKKWQDLGGIICYEGPGSFTGLRIGLTVGNALAHSLNIPIVATANENWIDRGMKLLSEGNGTKIVVPSYGTEAHITLPKK